MKSSLQSLLDFTKFTHTFQKVIRTIYVTSENRNENDLEHSGQLALIGWYLIESEKLKLNKDKVIKYCLAHDLVETYAGDTFLYTKNKALKNSKVQREKDALVRIKKEFPEFKELMKIIEKFEEKKDSESRFVYALDKMLPVLNIYLDSGRSWKREKVNLEMIRTKDDKVAISPEINKVWEELVKILDSEKDKLFK